MSDTKNGQASASPAGRLSDRSQTFRVPPDVGFTIAAWAPIVLVELLAAAIFVLVSEANDTTELFTVHEIAGLVSFAVLASIAITPVATTLARTTYSLRPRPVPTASEVSRLILGEYRTFYEGADEVAYNLFLEAAEESLSASVLRIETTVRQTAESVAAFLVAPLPTLVPTTLLWNRFGWRGLATTVFTVLYSLILAYLFRVRKDQQERRQRSAVASMILIGRNSVLESLGFRRPQSAADERASWQLVLSMLNGEGIMHSDAKYAFPMGSGNDQLVAEISTKLDHIASNIEPGTRTPTAIEYHGVVSAGFRDYPPRKTAEGTEFTLAPDRSYVLRVAIGGQETEAVSDTLTSEGRIAPSATFRIAPDAERIVVEPSELVVEAPRDGAVVYKDFRVTAPVDVGNAMLWIRIYQHRRLLQVLQLNVSVVSGGG